MRPRRVMRRRGFALVELLVAAGVAGVVLAASYGWLWEVAALAARQGDRAQAATIAASCVRAVTREVRASVAVAPPPDGRSPDRSVALVHDHPDVAPEDVLVVWDPARGVVWRNASGTYLADHVTAFSVAYALSDGRLVPGVGMQPADWAAVSCVRVVLRAEVGSAAVERTILAGVGPS